VKNLSANKEVLIVIRNFFLALLSGIAVASTGFILIWNHFQKEHNLSGPWEPELFSLLGPGIIAAVGVFISLFSVILYYLAIAISVKNNRELSKQNTLQSFESTFVDLLKAHKEFITNFSLQQRSQDLQRIVGLNEGDIISTLKNSPEELKIWLDIPEHKFKIPTEEIHLNTQEVFLFISSILIGTLKMKDYILSDPNLKSQLFINIRDCYNSKDQAKLKIESNQLFSMCVYNEIHSRFSNYIANSMRNFYHILKYIDDAEIENRSKYTKILQSSFSNAELLLIYFNSLFFGGTTMKLINDHKFLENLPKEIMPDDFQNFYSFSLRSINLWEHKSDGI
jgi:hypothetical protein